MIFYRIFLVFIVFSVSRIVIIFAVDCYFTSGFEIYICGSFAVNYSDCDKIMVFRDVAIAAVENFFYIFRV